jgi:thioredoxin 1
MTTRTANTENVISVGDDDIDMLVEGSNIALVEFYTEWCGTCKRLKPVLEELARDTDATILTIDIESNLETAIEFGAQSAPTFVLFVDGQPVKQLRGGQNEQTLRDLIVQYRD